MNYLSSEEIKEMHDEIIRKTGGLEGVLNEHALLMLETQPAQSFSGQELYPNIFSKAAFYLRSINKGHIFIDGNKRTSITAVKVFLSRNNYSFEVETKELKKFPIDVATKHLSLKEIELWIRNHSKIKNT
ncbi:MAG: type II toxin-antitoxin system death-on-curing family toxin [Promethearchaeota archaeon Loki_b32]|nr:MAG: type II toxin-antitoxin system death-on-curing family toxin [Candidatus Lokiarchaeota archaeon Loki_b32]